VDLETLTLPLAEAIDIPAMEREQIIKAATRAYLNRHPGKQVTAEILDRACVNYVRHELTTYDRFISKVASCHSFDALLGIFRRRVYRAIADTYPWLETECDRQLAARS